MLPHTAQRMHGYKKSVHVEDAFIASLLPGVQTGAADFAAAFTGYRRIEDAVKRKVGTLV